jgi:hypothetical protein
MPMADKDIARRIIAAIKEAKPDATVSEAEVCDTIDWLKKAHSPLFKYRDPNKEYAADWIKCIDKMLSLMNGRPDAIKPHQLFRPSIRTMNKGGFPTLTDGSENIRHLQNFLSELRDQCQWVIDSKIGVHRNYGYDQEQAAWAAAGLLGKHELLLTYSSDTNVFRVVAGLLYEAKSGHDSKDGVDIRRACQAVIQRRQFED